MSNFELIDEYLSNKLAAPERAAFEEQLGTDPGLKSDVEFQRQIVEGVKKARAAELKAMLNNVPIGGGLSSGLTAGKFAAGVVVASLVATGVYLYVSREKAESKEPSAIVSNSPAETMAPEEKSVVIPPADQPKVTEKPVGDETQKTKSKTSGKNERPKTTVATPTKIQVTDPSEELVDNQARDGSAAEGQKSSITTSHISVEAIATNKKYNFHYQFDGGKLVLYGPFDRSLYEILEIHGEKHLVFLFYKDNYYVLDEKQHKIEELQPIKDAPLLKKLKEYRSRQ